ncbi:hypothetical protein, partial [Staphylococcus epidermidis]|uniref:hypothetical protein n=1 Tax=Staphylococcus epidermidis TaxID=1282 RepID=UPI0016427374
VLEDVISEDGVVLKRAGRLERLGIEGFEGSVVEGGGIGVEGVVRSGYNGEFDGEEMGVEVGL